VSPDVSDLALDDGGVGWRDDPALDQTPDEGVVALDVDLGGDFASAHDLRGLPAGQVELPLLAIVNADVAAFDHVMRDDLPALASLLGYRQVHLSMLIDSVAPQLLRQPPELGKPLVTHQLPTIGVVLEKEVWFGLMRQPGVRSSRGERARLAASSEVVSHVGIS